MRDSRQLSSSNFVFNSKWIALIVKFRGQILTFDLSLVGIYSLFSGRPRIRRSLTDLQVVWTTR